MNILLVYPTFPDSYWSFRHALGLENRRSAFPPLRGNWLCEMPETLQLHATA